MSTGPGFAIRRNGTCLSGFETDCGITRSPFRGCCPNGLECPSQYNIACCPTGNNCTETLLAAPEPKCADPTWDLFDNGGYFCCEHGLAGFNKSNSNVCAQPGSSLSDVIILPTISTGIPSSTPVSGASSATASSSISGSSSATQPAPSTTSDIAKAQQSSTPPVGAIVGGVVGGVLGLALLGLLAWFLIRRKRKNPYDAQKDVQSNNEQHEAVYEAMGSERHHMQQLDGNPVMDANKTRYAHVNEQPMSQDPVELHADSRAPN